MDAKADVGRANRYGVTPLSLACVNGNEAIVRLLLDAGDDPNAKLRGDQTLPHDRLAHRKSRRGEGAARERGGRQREGASRADRADVGGGRRVLLLKFTKTFFLHLKAEHRSPTIAQVGNEDIFSATTLTYADEVVGDI